MGVGRRGIPGGWKLKTRKKNSRHFSVFHLTLNVYLSPRDDVHDLLISLILISGTFWELDPKILENC